MRLLVISDIHANLAAFEAVLADAAGKYDFIWFMGDLVGYGPDPNECVSLLQEYDHLALSGNHDWAVLGKLDIAGFNPEAKFAIEWAQSIITDESLTYLASLDSITSQEPFTLAHASIRQPVWEYILDKYTAAVNFVFLPTPYGIIGHTHVPVIYEERGQNSIAQHSPNYDTPIQIGRSRLLINPGSVGQPRDSDPRSSYALLDTETLMWQFCRVEYDIKRTQVEMRKFNLPERLVSRLSYGW